MFLAIIRFTYNFLFLLLLPLLFARLFLRSLKVAGNRQRWSERLGIFAAPAKTGGIWVHTVSVGEFIAALPLIRALQQQYPHELITVTTTTLTGSERVRASLGTSVFHVYLPYDVAFGIKKFLRKVQPKLCIILETELWFNLLHYCKAMHIPVLIVNGCISPHSLPKYLKIRWLMQHLLQNVDQVLAKSVLDGQRFLQLGLPTAKLSVPGNIKYDLHIQPQHVQLGQQLKKSFVDRIVLVAASTHDGEEQQLLTALRAVKQQVPQLLLILVPRHPERFNIVADLITTSP